MTTEVTTAKAMVEILRRHYLPEGRQPAGIFAPEIAAPASDRRADLIWQGLTASGRELIGHEIKVNRGDLLAELADPTKSDPWMQYCDRWYLVLPHMALVDGLDLPETWGVMTPPSGRRTRSMTIEVKAPKLKPAEQSPALRTIAAWLHWRLHSEKVHHANSRREVEELRTQLQQAQAMIPNTYAARQRTAEEALIKQIIDGVGFEDGRLGGWRGNLNVTDVIVALKNLAAVRDATVTAENRVAYMRDDAKRMYDELNRLLGKGREVAP